MSGEPTVYVIDDDKTALALMQLLMRSVHLPVETFASATDFLERYPGDGAGCLVLDVRLPDMDGLELQRVLAERGVVMPVIVVTAHADVPMAVRAIRAGALDFIEKPYSSQQLLDRVREALRVDSERRELQAEIASVRARLALLTPREVQILEETVEGHSTKEIARSLALSTKTVEGHRTRLMEKMEAGTVASLVRMALLARSLPLRQNPDNFTPRG